MTLPRVLVAILDFLNFLWTLFTVDSPKPVRLVGLPFSTKPFRLLHLPSLAHDVIFSQIEIADIYHLSKCSCRSRYAVKVFTRRQKYDFSITPGKSFCYLEISNRLGGETFYRVLRPMDIRKLLSFFTYHSEDFWATTKKEIAHFLDVFTKNVNCLHFYDITIVKNVSEFLKEKTALPVDWVVYDVRVIDDEIYKYVWKEFKNAKTLSISASPSIDFRFDDMEPFAGDAISIKNADCLTVDNLIRCFMNVEKVRLWTDSKRYLNVHVFNQFLNAWRNGFRVGKLDLMCDCANLDLQSIFKNIPKTEVKRVKVGKWKRVFDDGQCFLIRQEDSGVEAIVYFTLHYNFINHCLCFTTDFRLLRDDESAVNSFDSDNDSEDDDDEEGDSESDEDS